MRLKYLATTYFKRNIPDTQTLEKEVVIYK